MRSPELEQAFREACGARHLGRTIEWHDDLPSTQDRARELARSGAPDGTIVATVTQHTGRGRSGAHWHSPSGGLWITLLLYPRGTAQDAAELTLALARAVRESLDYDFCVPATIKLPNDLMVGGRKIAGILGESSSRAGEAGVDWMVLGLGLNVANEIPAEIGGLATRLADHLTTPPALPQLLARIVERFELAYRPDR